MCEHMAYHIKHAFNLQIETTKQFVRIGLPQLRQCTASGSTLLFGPRREKTCLRVFVNNTGADQPAHPRRLISALVTRFLESIICKLATDEISIF